MVLKIHAIVEKILTPSLKVISFRFLPTELCYPYCPTFTSIMLLEEISTKKIKFDHLKYVQIVKHAVPNISYFCWFFTQNLTLL